MASMLVSLLTSYTDTRMPEGSQAATTASGHEHCASDEDGAHPTMSAPRTKEHQLYRYPSTGSLFQDGHLVFFLWFDISFVWHAATVRHTWKGIQNKTSCLSGAAATCERPLRLECLDGELRKVLCPYAHPSPCSSSPPYGALAFADLLQP